MFSMVPSRDVLRKPYFKVLFNEKEIPSTYHDKLTVQFEDPDNKLDAVRVTALDSSIAQIDYPYPFFFVNNADLVKNAKLWVDMGHVDNHRVVFDGVISNVDYEFGENGIITVTITGINSAVDMTIERKSRKWANVKHSDVAKEVLNGYGFYCIVEDSIWVMEQITQNDENDLEFVNRLASEVGFKFYSTNPGEYYFGKDEKKDNYFASLNYYCNDCSIKNATISFVKPSDITDSESDIDSTSGEEETREETAETGDTSNAICGNTVGARLEAGEDGVTVGEITGDVNNEYVSDQVVE